MKNKLTAKVHRHSKSAGKETRSQSIERGVSGNDVLPSIKRESTSSNGSPRKRKERVRTQIQTTTNDIPRLNYPKKTYKLFKEQSFESLVNEVPPSIKRGPSFEDSAKVKKTSVKTRRIISNREMSGNFTTSPQNEENEDFSTIKREPSFEDSAEIKKSIVKTGRKTSAKEISSKFTTSSQNKEKVSSKNEKNPSTAEYSATVEKEDRETRRLDLSTLKTHSEKQWSPQGIPPTTPYALNRPQRNRIPPLAYWRGEHRSFRTLVNGDIVLVDFHIPEYSEEPQRKRRKLSEKTDEDY